MAKRFTERAKSAHEVVNKWNLARIAQAHVLVDVLGAGTLTVL
jgi:hypothetical protein